MKILISILFLVLFFMGCRHQADKHKKTFSDSSSTKQMTVIKPQSNFTDSITINTRAAVFYYPDSVQLHLMRATSDPTVFEAVMHEYFYQVQFAHTTLKNHWPKIKIVEARNTRYLVFLKADKSTFVIDLNTKYDPYGLFLFDPSGFPSKVDMTNAESQIKTYFAEASDRKHQINQ